MAASFFLTVPKDEKLYPFNVLREESSLHFGVRSIANQWKDLLQAKPDVAVHPRLLPNEHNVSVVMGLQPSQAWTHGDITYAQHGKDVSDTISPTEPDLLTDAPALFERVAEGLAEDLSRLKRIWRLRTLAEEEREAWASAGVVVHGPMDKVHLAPGATLRDASLNTEQGDILLGPDSEVMEGCRIRGPFALGEDSVLRMGALVYGPTAIGKSCKAGGELSNVVIHDCSNKAHGGFLGNSVIGSWCNLVPKPRAAISKTPMATSPSGSKTLAVLKIGDAPFVASCWATTAKLPFTQPSTRQRWLGSCAMCLETPLLPNICPRSHGVQKE